MRPCPLILRVPHLLPRARASRQRSLLTLAIETSCDDTSVAILEKKTCPTSGRTGAILHFHKKITSNNTSFQGVHPLVSLYSHQENLANLLDEALLHLPPNDAFSKKIPDFISVTRGPGMRSNLFTGLDTAKGLAVAWQKDLVGVHHMQAHALTPRLVKALQNSEELGISSMKSSQEALIPASINMEPEFPFLSVLAWGGHTLLIHSASLTDHKVMASTKDIAVGECLDKIARSVLPPQIVQTARSTMYGALLENFAFSEPPIVDADKNTVQPEIEKQASNPEKEANYRLEDSTAREYCAIYGTRYTYGVPKNHEEALKQNTTKWGWGFNQPLAKAAGGLKSRSMEMSFSGLMTAVERVARYQVDQSTGKLTKNERCAKDISIEERRDMAREAMRAAFEHVATRVVLGLQQITPEKSASHTAATVVMAGGVAANSYLRYILASMLCAHGYPDVRIVFPPASLCTDNAAMIAWAGLEMYQAGFSDPRSIRAIRKWPLGQLLSPPKDD